MSPLVRRWLFPCFCLPLTCDLCLSPRPIKGKYSLWIFFDQGPNLHLSDPLLQQVRGKLLDSDPDQVKRSTVSLLSG